MTFLPIVERELRVVARKRSTFWLRVAAAAIALVIGGFGMVVARTGGTGPLGPGRFLFGALTWPLVCGLFATGLFFTSDCLSEEKREGTLGFLFLTDLRGYDVVAGKLLATSLRSLFPLLAFFPILAVTLLMGGVTGGQFWKTSLALLNALFFSLAAGLFVSAISRDSQKALAATLLLLLLLILGGPIADASIAAATNRGFQPFFSYSSPGFVFKAAGGWGRTFFWESFATTQVIAWFLFALACLLIPHTWQQKSGKKTVASRSWTYSWKYGNSARRARRRRKLLLPNPMLWLTSRERWQAMCIWLIAALALGGFSILLFAAPPEEAWIAWSFISGLLMLVLYLWAASQSCRFFIEARRSGLIELLLATPLSEVNIVRGHWRGLLRMFAAPILLLILLQLVSVVLSQSSIQRMMSAVSTTRAVATTNSASSTTVTVNTTISPNTNPSAKLSNVEWALILTAGFADAAATAANIVALCWFGMWMGISAKNANIATLLTLLFVQVIPWMVIGITSLMLSGLVLLPFFSGASMPFSYQLAKTLIYGLLCLLKDVGFIVFSRKKLYSSFRAQALKGISPPVLAIPPPMSAPPPVIASPAT